MKSKGQSTTGRRRVAVLVHLLANVMLGLSLGLFSYYGITDIQSRLSQDALDETLLALGPIASPIPAVEPTAGPTGWETWASEDEAYWNGLAHGEVFGRLVIEDIDLDVVVVKGTERDDLKLGPGWIVQTDYPGETGNVGISGHRTTYGSPFRDIDVLEPGDTIEFYSPYRRYVYEVKEQLVVRPDQIEVVASTEEPLLTLTACHPPYSAAFRIVVQSALVEMIPLASEEDGG